MLRPVPMPGPTTGLHLPGRSRSNLCSCWGEGGSVGCWRLKSSSPGKRPTLHATASSRHLGHAILHFTTPRPQGWAGSWWYHLLLGVLLAVLLLQGTPTVRGWPERKRLRFRRFSVQPRTTASKWGKPLSPGVLGSLLGYLPFYCLSLPAVILVAVILM